MLQTFVCQQFNTPHRLLRQCLGKTPVTITSEDMSLGIQKVFKPISDLKQRENFYNKVFRKGKEMTGNAWIKKAQKRSLNSNTKQRINVDFNMVVTTHPQPRCSRERTWYTKTDYAITRRLMLSAQGRNSYYVHFIFHIVKSVPSAP